VNPKLVQAVVLVGLTPFTASATCAGAEAAGDSEFDAIDNFVETGMRAVRRYRPWLRVRRPAAGTGDSGDLHFTTSGACGPQSCLA
jgi:hypothetical protein